MKYFTVKEFVEKFTVSKPTLYRFYKKHPEIKEETKKENGRRLIPKNHYMYFDIKTLRDENDLLKKENQTLLKDNESMKNLIYGLSNPESFGYKLWHMPWTYFVTVSYNEPKSQRYCYNKMTKLYEALESDFGKYGVRLFFTTEKHATREGYHTHAVIYTENDLYRYNAKKKIEKHLRPHRLDIQPYTKLKGAVFYMLKEGLQGEDWDIYQNTHAREELDKSSKNKLNDYKINRAS